MIGDRPVGPDHPPMVIAEMSGNHNQSLDRAFELVDAAAEAGSCAQAADLHRRHHHAAAAWW